MVSHRVPRQPSGVAPALRHYSGAGGRGGALAGATDMTFSSFSALRPGARVVAKLVLFLVAGGAFAVAARGAGLRPVQPRCEYRENPLGLDTPAPRLSWELVPADPRERDLRPTAIQVLVAREPSSLRPGQADLWDSGELGVGSDEAPPVSMAYAGSPLISRQQCWWVVRVRDQDRRWSDWSPAAFWTMGLLRPEDWTGKWIGTGETFQRGRGSPPPDTAAPDPWFRKTIQLPAKPIRATAHVASVGYHELWINGSKVGEDVLQPSVTDHSKRARYNTYEIGGLLRAGPNVIGLWLGTGWSIFPKFETPDKPRAPIVLAQVDCDLPGPASLRIGTDETWVTHPSPSRLLGVWDFTQFGGERYEAGREPDGPVGAWSDSAMSEVDWKPAKVFAPKLVLSADPVEPNRRLTSLKPVAITEPKPGVYRVDFGRNFAGMYECDLRGGQPGDVIEMQWSEQEARPMTHRLRNQYVFGPGGRGTFRNRFNYGIGRWLTVTGLRTKPEPADFRAWLVRTDYASGAAFECSNPLFNRIHEVTRWTFESLSLGGYLVDCPHRERMGYGGDAHATTTTGLMNYRLGALYTKWAEDWRDSQGRGSAWGVGAGAAQAGLEPGNLPYTAPTYWGGGGPGWCGFVVHLPSEMWRAYGDRRLVETMLPTVERWLAFLETKQRDNLLRRWGGEWDFLGDWLWPGAQGVNGDTRETLFFNNAYWIYNLQIAAQLAAVLGRNDQATAWNLRADAVRRAVHREFFDPATANYVDGSQAYLALALVAGVPPAELRPAVVRRLEEEILVKRRGHIHAGITGGAFLFRALRELGRDDLLYAMVAQETYPSWGDMLKQGATTMWESWENNPDLSYLHSSYLYVGAWFIQGVLGIQPLPESPGFARFGIRPAPVDRPDLAWARGHYDSVRGRIASAWKRVDRGFELEVTVPPGTRAVVHLPAGAADRVSEGGGPLERSKGIRLLGVDAGRVLVEVGSGTYRFVVAEP